MKKIVLGVLLSLAFAAPAAAKETKLSEAQIRELFVGQTIKGIHYGKETRQYFSKSGLTLWVSEGDETLAEGRYEIKNGQYCSSWTGLWNKEKWGCLDIVEDKDQGLYYFIGKDFRAPFVRGGSLLPQFD